MQLHFDRFPERAVLDTAVSHALLRRVGRGHAPESLRLYRPDDELLFSSLDARRPGYPRALELARAAGFEPVVRLAGGHAAAFLSSSLAFAWATPDPEASLHIRPRFVRLANWIVGALRALGLDARVGELPGEYCPGEFSVNLAGRIKVMGVGQRVIRGAAHVGGVITIADTARLREVLVPIYDALELEFDPATAGGLVDAHPGLTAEDVVQALEGLLRAEGVDVVHTRFDPEIEREADLLRSFHEPRPTSRHAALAELSPPAAESPPASSLSSSLSSSLAAKVVLRPED